MLASLDSDKAHLLGDWLFALAILFLTAVAASVTRRFLARVKFSGQSRILLPLLPSGASIVYIVGLRVFAEVAPLPARSSAWLEGGIYVVSVLILLNLARKAAVLAVEWVTVRAGASPTLQQGFVPMIRNLITLFVFSVGAIMVLKHFNYDVMSIVTALGVGSLAVGLAAKETLSNMISGFTLIIDRNLTPGDRINLGGLVGDVEEIGLRSTRMRMGDGNMLIVPNSELVNTKILNLSLPTRELLCTSTFRAPYTEPFDRLRNISVEVFDELRAKDPRTFAPLRDPSITLSSLADGAQTVTVSFWVTDMSDQGAALSLFNENALERMRREGVVLVRVVQ